MGTPYLTGVNMLAGRRCREENMLVHELTRQESLDVLARTHLGRLACSRSMQPYIVPIHFVYRNGCLYGFSTPGQKIDWMRANPLVCVEADEMRREHWTTVVVLGRFEELPDAAETRGERAVACRLLQQNAAWWETATARIAQGGDASALDTIFYRINIVKISGRHGSIEPTAPGTRQFTTNLAKRSWLHELLRRVRGR
jgi:nitroimidazol reductase NimA-like FMN-containing flavoprotein (pyridoxamine 5'-phosphate oxidase superfamily)